MSTVRPAGSALPATALASGSALGPLAGCSPRLAAAGLAGDYAAQLLRSLGAYVAPPPPPADAALEAARVWAQSGLAALTGYADGPPLMGPAALPSCARGALCALTALAPGPALAGLDGAALLGERAALLGLRRGGQCAANGACHLLAAADGTVAVNLARAADRAMLPALLQVADTLDTLAGLRAAVAASTVAELVERGRLMGLPVAPASAPAAEAPAWFRIHARSRRGASGQAPAGPPTVVDLSSLWAGPLCSHLLQLAGARVIKVESADRPDGARYGNRAFYDLLNAGKHSVALDFGSRYGRAQLRALLLRADIVIEGSRPRALQQLGIIAEELLELRPQLTWLSITGYGRADPFGHWVAFGDDAAVAAGVAAACGEPPLFCGDALADPLTGLHAALAAQAFYLGGGGVLVDLSLSGVTAHCLGCAPALPRAASAGSPGAWQLATGAGLITVQPPRARAPHGQAAASGAHNALWLSSPDGGC